MVKISFLLLTLVVGERIFAASAQEVGSGQKTYECPVCMEDLELVVPCFKKGQCKHFLGCKDCCNKCMVNGIFTCGVCGDEKYTKKEIESLLQDEELLRALLLSNDDFQQKGESKSLEQKAESAQPVLVQSVVLLPPSYQEATSVFIPISQTNVFVRKIMEEYLTKADPHDVWWKNMKNLSDYFLKNNGSNQTREAIKNAVKKFSEMAKAANNKVAQEILMFIDSTL